MHVEPASTATSDTLIDLVARALAYRRQGAAVDVDALCAAHPQHRTAVAEALGLAPAAEALATVDPDPLLQRQLGGRYALGARLGAGAMGVVYRAHDSELGRDVAIKVLQPGLFDSPAARDRLWREAAILARLRHPGIVAVHDRGRTDDGLHYVVMDLVLGVPLSAVAAAATAVGGDTPVPAAFTDANWLRRCVGVLPEATYLRAAVRWCAEVADALQSAHALGVCHRDVKPSNIVVQDDGRAVLLDFGIAALTDAGARTATGGVRGTPWYMAPETVRGNAGAQPAQDVWSLGATLFHLLTGQPPFPGEAAEVLLRVQTELPATADSLHPGLPRDLCAIVAHALDPEPRRRYATAAAFAADLVAFLAHRPVAARPRSAMSRGWWRVRRAPARVLARAALVLGFAATGFGFIAYREVAAATARSRAEQQANLIRALPATLALEADAASPLAEHVRDRTQALALLDAVLALGDDLPTRLLRAALHLDHGEHAAAQADLRHFEAAEHSPYLSAVAARYAMADSSRRGMQALGLSDLPAPTTAVDKFVAGFHALRQQDADAAAALLAEAMPMFPPARDLRVLALLAQARSRGDAEQARALAQLAYDEAMMLVGLNGKTARTQHAIGAACIMLKRYADAEQPLRDSIALRPGRSGPLTNLGIVLHRLGRLDEAVSVLQAALAGAPPTWQPRHTLALIAGERRDFATARRWAEQIPDEHRGQRIWQKPYLHAHLAVTLADQCLGVGDDAGARAAASEALQHYAAAARAGAKPNQTAIGAAYATALVSPSTETLCAFLRLAAADPANPVHVRNIAFLLPGDGGVDAATAHALREFLAAQAHRLSPDQAEHREFLQRMRR